MRVKHKISLKDFIDREQKLALKQSSESTTPEFQEYCFGKYAILDYLKLKIQLGDIEK